MSPPNHQPQPQSQPNSEPEEVETQQLQTPQVAQEKKKKNTVAIAILIVRIITLLFLLISLIIIVSNKTTIVGVNGIIRIVRFNSFNTYRYMVSVTIICLVHTSSQIVSGIKRLSTGKGLIVNQHDYAMPIINFFGNQVILCLLATAVGAGFGATLESKKTLDVWDDMLQIKGDFTLVQSRPKLDTFFNVANISSFFLTIAFLTCAISSSLSAFSLSPKR